VIAGSARSKGRGGIEPISVTIPDRRQRLARYYGVHPYFTRRSAAVVAAYVERYSRIGDVVADPFGGSGVTAIEALLMHRKAVHNDLNPFANFLTRVIADTSLESTAALKRAFEAVEERCGAWVRGLEQASEPDVRRALSEVALPRDIPLPRTSDARSFHELFTPRQLAALAGLKCEIDAIGEASVRDHLLLAWSAAAAKLNKTFISAHGRKESRGGSSIFSIYRYKLAKSVVELPLWETFRQRFLNVVAAKEEVLAIRDLSRRGADQARPAIDSRTRVRILQEDAAALTRSLGTESVDYVFTDPPYGAHIAYLDLSTLWNHWLGFAVTDRMREEETIVGGERRLTEDHYKARLAESMKECVRLLKPDRWMSVVFQHWDTSYFKTILDSVSDMGADLRAAVTQEREVIWSMHKKKNSQNVLGGEMILTFYKPPRLRTREWIAREKPCSLLPEMLDLVLTREMAGQTEFTSQYLFNRLVLLAWQRQSLTELNVSREAFAEELRCRGGTTTGAGTFGRAGARAGRICLLVATEPLCRANVRAETRLEGVLPRRQWMPGRARLPGAPSVFPGVSAGPAAPPYR
jgi:adenine-specific DNA methylase